MVKKNGAAMGVVITCMAAIILFGRIILGPLDGSTAVAGVYQEEPIYQVDTVDDDKNQVNVIHNDTYDEVNKEDALDQKQEVSTAHPIIEEKPALLQEEIKKQQKEEREQKAQKAVDIKNPSIEVSAKAALLYNKKSGKVLYSKNALEEIQPASTAKLLTAITAIELCDKDEQFNVGSEINLIASDSSRAYLVKGQILSLENILDALLLPSGNDAAYVIAANMGRKIAGDSSMKAKKAVEKFVEAMNKKAEEIGVVHSNFMSPDGYDAKGQYTTAYDMALIGAKALDYKEILETVKKPRTRDILISGEDITWSNSNRLIKQGSGYYYSYAIGLKTGTSGKAGRCLVSAAKKKNHVYVSVVMNASPEGRWQDSVDLLRYAIGLE